MSRFFEIRLLMSGLLSLSDLELWHAAHFIQPAKVMLLSELGRHDVPHELDYIWAQLAVLLYREQAGLTASLTQGEIGEGAIKSITEGDTTIQFGTADSTEALAKTTTVRQLLEKNKFLLNRSDKRSAWPW